MMYLHGSVLLWVGAQFAASRMVSYSVFFITWSSKQSFGEIVLRFNILSNIIDTFLSLNVELGVFVLKCLGARNNLMVIIRTLATAAKVGMETIAFQEQPSSTKQEIKSVIN